MTKDQNQASAMTDEKWLVVDGLVYSLRDGANYNEINVSMVDGSRATADRNALANRIAAILSAATPAQQTEAPKDAMTLEKLLPCVTGKFLGEREARTLLNGDEIVLSAYRFMAIINAAIAIAKEKAE